MDADCFFASAVSHEMNRFGLFKKNCSRAEKLGSAVPIFIQLSTKNNRDAMGASMTVNRTGSAGRPNHFQNFKQRIGEKQALSFVCPHWLLRV